MRGFLASTSVLLAFLIVVYGLGGWLETFMTPIP